MRVAHIAAEVAPWCTSGGLGQVMGALPAAIAETGEVTVDAFFPLCRDAANEPNLNLEEVAAGLPAGTRLLRRSNGAASTYFVDAPQYFDRDSLYGPYGDPYADDAERFAFFNESVIAALETTGVPDIVHAHDWHSAPAAAYLAAAAPKTVLTVHNLAYQGVFPTDESISGLSAKEGSVNFLRNGIISADEVTTVSPTYAQEMLEEGFGLEEELAERKAPVGILNGIDTTEWDPEHDSLLPRSYSATDLAGKQTARAALATAMGIDAPEDDLIVGVVSRFAEQKGIDLILEVAADASDLGMRLVVLGDGDQDLEAGLSAAAGAQPDRVAVSVGWNKAMAHLVIAGADALAIPSRFEPCGLTQMQAMRYGTIPIVHAVGGLVDTVTDVAAGGSGFAFDEPTAPALASAIERASIMHRGADWRTLVTQAMGHDWSWGPAAAAYVNLYRSLLG